jgi:AraC family transcriptional regulator, regulatory protein of adaptative response / methylated-DNA-[protein]-cysteine methyltransferase
MSNEIGLNEDGLWDAVQNRDATRDGEFFYGVMTTGVYCRPSCASRRPLRKNVRFFSTTGEAESAGLRPCKRCRPKGASSAVLNKVVHELARQIEAQPEQTFSLEQLAQRAGYSPFHLQRSFKAIMGSSPK